MGREDNFHRKIRESFDQKSNAPEDLWDKVSSELNNTTSPIDEKVSQSFSQFSSEAPEQVWTNINQQLTIDRGWAKVQSYLTRSTFIRKFQTAAVFILLPFLFWLQPSVDGDFLVADHSYKMKSFHKEVNKESFLKKEITMPLSEDHESDESLADNNFKRDEKIKEQSPPSTPMKLSSSDLKVAANDSDKKNDKFSNLQALSEASNLKALSFVQPLSFSSFKYSTAPSLITFDEKEDDPFKKSIEVGLIFALNESMIINNDLKRAFDTESLVSYVPELDNQFGAVVGVRLKPNFSVHGMLLHSHLKHSFDKYEKGQLIKEKTDFKFLKVQVLGQYRHFLRQEKNAVTIKAGPYFSYLYSQEVSLGDQIIADADKQVRNTDTGITLQIGMEHQIYSKWILDYGVNASKGLLNLNSGVTKKTVSFNTSRYFETGFYISLRYKF